MAIYHLNVSIGSRGGGQSAAAKSDYIEREGKYAKGAEEVAYVEHGHMPEFSAKSPRQYWEAADLYERENGRLFRQVEFALPVEFTLEEQIALAHDFAQHLTAAEKMPYTLAIHKGAYDHQGKATDPPENPHVHLIISERANDGIERSAEQWFKRANKKQPERGGAAKTKVMESRDWLLATRERWADMANAALERHGHQSRIDHRTLEAQGITDRLPQTHRGTSGRMEQRGIKTHRSKQRWQRERDTQEIAALSAAYQPIRTEHKRIKDGLALKDGFAHVVNLYESAERDLSAVEREIAAHRQRLEKAAQEVKNSEQTLEMQQRHLERVETSGFFPSLFNRKAIHRQRQVEAAAREKNTTAKTAYDGILAEGENLAQQRTRLNGVLSELSMEAAERGRVIREIVVERLTGAKKTVVLTLWHPWEREIDKVLSAETPIVREQVKLKKLSEIIADPAKVETPAQQWRRFIAEFDASRYRAVRDVGRAAYDTIGGDLSLLPELERVLQRQGYLLDRKRLEGVRTVEMREAFGKAVKESPQRMTERLKRSRSQERGGYSP